MSRQTIPVQVAPLITRHTRLEDLPDIDPDAIRALSNEGIETIRQLRATSKDIAIIVYQAMRNRPRAASASVHALNQFRINPLPNQGVTIHDRMSIKDIPNMPQEAVTALFARGITTVAQLRGRRSQIPSILQRVVPRQAREVSSLIQQCLNPGPLPQSVSSV